MWNKAEEMAYWTAEHRVYYIDNILKKWSFFNKLYNINGERFKLAVDIGGGRFGGALRRFTQANQHILVDALAPEFRKLGDLPVCVDSITADFANIPLKTECADIVFAWNVYDHANNNLHFEEGVFEALRILKTGGLFFGSFPLRKVPNNNHPVCLTVTMVFDAIKVFGAEILNDLTVGEPHYREETLFVVARKS